MVTRWVPRDQQSVRLSSNLAEPPGQREPPLRPGFPVLWALDRTRREFLPIGEKKGRRLVRWSQALPDRQLEVLRRNRGGFQRG